MTLSNDTPPPGCVAFQERSTNNTPTSIPPPIQIQPAPGQRYKKTVKFDLFRSPAHLDPFADTSRLLSKSEPDLRSPEYSRAQSARIETSTSGHPPPKRIHSAVAPPTQKAQRPKHLFIQEEKPGGGHQRISQYSQASAYSQYSTDGDGWKLLPTPMEEDGPLPGSVVEPPAPPDTIGQYKPRKISSSVTESDLQHVSRPQLAKVTRSVSLVMYGDFRKARQPIRDRRDQQRMHRAESRHFPPTKPIPQLEKAIKCSNSCCGCSPDHDWYSCYGKGCCWIIPLLLFYIIFGPVIAVFLFLALLLICVTCQCDKLLR